MCLEEEGQDWYIEMFNRNRYGVRRVSLGTMKLQSVDLLLTSISLNNANLNLLLKVVHWHQLLMRYLEVSCTVKSREVGFRLFLGGQENRELLLLLAQKLTVQEARDREATNNGNFIECICESKVTKGNELCEYRVYSIIPKSEESALSDFTTMSAKKVLVKPPETVDLYLCSVEIHDIS